jgi:hypothetical protein
MTSVRTKLLFILKKRSNYGVSYGLVNSCRFIAEALKSYNVESVIEEVVDNNKIDCAVSQHKPSHVFIEALWVVPEKFPILIELHPSVKWYVRLHSQTPFLSNEGIAFQWLAAYNKLAQEDSRFNISANADKLVKELTRSLNYNVEYLPNIYNQTSDFKYKFNHNKKDIHIGVFGAIRPMKNHVEQAIASMIYARLYNKQLFFHVNSTNFEAKTGESIIKNLRNLFAGTEHQLVEHDWLNHEDFIKIIKTIDIALQVSFSETFNIVAADFVANNIPVIGSKEINWMSQFYQASPNDAFEIAQNIDFALSLANLNIHGLNKFGLKAYNKKSLNTWLKFLNIR